MEAVQFLRSAEVAAPALSASGAAVGSRIEAAMRATWDTVGCNTNLGIVLLCAPLARAAELLWLHQRPLNAGTLRRQLDTVLQDLDLDDAAGAYRAIALVQPGGLGQAEAQDVRQTPSINLREAMTLAAGRDRIALQYAQGFAELFELGLPGLQPHIGGLDPAALRRAVQLCFLQWLRSAPDTHIERKHGRTTAQSVQELAQDWWHTLLQAGPPMPGPEDDPAMTQAWATWDEQLKQHGLNPGTSADLTVASAFLAALLDPSA